MLGSLEISIPSQEPQEVLETHISEEAHSPSCRGMRRAESRRTPCMTYVPLLVLYSSGGKGRRAHVSTLSSDSAKLLWRDVVFFGLAFASLEVFLTPGVRLTPSVRKTSKGEKVSPKDTTPHSSLAESEERVGTWPLRPFPS